MPPELKSDFPLNIMLVGVRCFCIPGGIVYTLVHTAMVMGTAQCLYSPAAWTKTWLCALYVCYLWLSKKICINLWGQTSFAHKHTALLKTLNRTEHLLLCVSSIAPFPSVTLSHASLSQLQPHFPFNTYNFFLSISNPPPCFFLLPVLSPFSWELLIIYLCAFFSLLPHSSLLHPCLLPPVFLHTAFSPSSMWIAGMVF